MSLMQSEEFVAKQFEIFKIKSVELHENLTEAETIINMIERESKNIQTIPEIKERIFELKKKLGVN